MKTFVGGPTQISSTQIRLRELFSVERLLSARGFQVKKEASARDTILEKDHWSSQDLDLVFGIFNDPQKKADLVRTVLEPGYSPLSDGVRALTAMKELRRDRQRFSSTFEWFIGELLIRRFQSFSSSFGVIVADVTRGSDGETIGDYDVLSVLGDMGLLYIECKTGKCHQTSILNSIERSITLHSVACVIVLESGVSKAMLLQQLRGQRHPRFGTAPRLATIGIRGLPDSTIYEWSGCFFLFNDATTGIESRLRTVMRILAAYRSSIFEEIRPQSNEYSLMGYDYSEDECRTLTPTDRK
jgi:hypothetical protein